MLNAPIRAAEGTEIERVMGALIMAFGSDPLARWLWPEAEAYLRNFPRFVRAVAGRAFSGGTAHVDDTFAGAALWLAPGVEPDGVAVEALFYETVQAPDDAMSLLEQMATHQLEEEHWYLPFIGVDQTRQGEGIGSKILSHQLAVCDTNKLPANLESSNEANVSLYERHGFAVVAEIQQGTSPTIRPMLRKPR